MVIPLRIQDKGAVQSDSILTNVLFVESKQKKAASIFFFLSLMQMI